MDEQPEGRRRGLLDDAGTQATLALLAVLAVVALFLVVRDTQAQDAKEEREREELQCALAVDAGQVPPSHC